MDINEQVKYLMQGADYGDPAIADAMARELRERLFESEKTGRPLNVYCGFDPTSSDLHLGHTVPMRKLAQFQELGHNVYFVIGTFTSLIGDPSDRDKSRPLLSREKMLENSKTYEEQAFRVLDPQKTRVVYNGDWLTELKLDEIFKLATNFTLQQILAREGFHKRMVENEAIYLHELFYPLSQGFDAHHLDTDVQIGGTDQLYNVITASRKIMQFYGQRPNIGILMPLLPGTDGDMKMSKSLGNYIPINTTAEDMYGKVMSLPDKVMVTYATLVTQWKPQDLARFTTSLETGSLHPRDAKMQLAFAITSLFYGAEAAQNAQDQFVATFQKGEIPDEMPGYQLQGDETVLDVMVSQGMVPSRSQGRRLLDQQGVRVDGVVVSDQNTPLQGGSVLQVGKRHFLRLKR